MCGEKHRWELSLAAELKTVRMHYSVLLGGTMKSKAQQDLFDAFYESGRNSEILDPKTTILIHLAAAMAVGCSP